MTIVDGIDSLAYQSPALKWPPLGKLLLCICLLVGSLSSRTLYGPLIVLGAGLFLFLYSVRLKAPVFMLYLIASILLFNIVGVAIIAVTQSGAPLFSVSLDGIRISVSQGGIDIAMLVFLRTLAGMFVMLFLASSTPVPHLFSALTRVGLPVYISEVTIMIYRYSFMIMEQSVQMTNAAACRLGFSGWKTSMRTTGVLAANLFVRSLEFAERSQYALQSRNFGGEFPVFKKPAALNARWVLCSGALLVVVFLAGNYL